MPRSARLKSESGYYHIILRGINKYSFFHDDEDRIVFLNRLKAVKKESDYDVVAYCLMENHIHLLLKEDKMPIGEIMKKILSRYVFWYNAKYERVGHLFQNRYKSEPIETDEYMLCCARYILQNPVAGGLCDNVWGYRWSSASLFLSDKKSFINSDILIEMLGSSLVEFIETPTCDKFLEWETKVPLTDERAREKISKVLKNKSIDDVMHEGKLQRNIELFKILQIEGISMRQVSRITGISIGALRRINK